MTTLPLVPLALRQAQARREERDLVLTAYSVGIAACVAGIIACAVLGWLGY
jgi:hypothetical protein